MADAPKAPAAGRACNPAGRLIAPPAAASNRASLARTPANLIEPALYQQIQ
jgi:hypothetical protein